MMLQTIWVIVSSKAIEIPINKLPHINSSLVIYLNSIAGLIAITVQITYEKVWRLVIHLDETSMPLSFIILVSLVKDTWRNFSPLFEFFVRRKIIFRYRTEL
jgi:hypothetical protein